MRWAPLHRPGPEAALSALTHLIEARDADFVWMLGGAPSRPELRLPPGGVDDRETVIVVRSIHDALGGDGHPGSWLMVSDGEIVGLCGFARSPSASGEVEIGYSVAPARRRLGHAGRAVGALLAIAERDAAAHWVTAVTAQDNLPSQAVLIRHGFLEDGREVRDEEGPVILWRLRLGRRES